MRNEDTLRTEFSYITPEINRYETRFIGLNSGFCLMTLIYTMQAMLGVGKNVGVIRESAANIEEAMSLDISLTKKGSFGTRSKKKTSSSKASKEGRQKLCEQNVRGLGHADFSTTDDKNAVQNRGVPT